MITMRPENMGIRLRSTDFYTGNRRGDLNKEPKVAGQPFRKEIKVTALSAKHISSIHREVVSGLVEQREKQIEAILERRGLLN